MFALASMLPLSIAVFLCSMFYPNTMVALFSNSIGIMIMSTVIQRPEEIMDNVTQLRKYNSYADDMRKVYHNGNHISVILVNIANYSSIYHILGYDETNSLLRRIADALTRMDKELNAFANIYYLDRGRFRITINSFNTNKVKKYAYDVNELLKQRLIAKHIDIALNAYVCVARCPEDLEDFDTMMSFGSDFHNKVHNTGDVIYAEELFKQREFSLINQMDDIIDRALDNGNLSVYYQPIYSVEKECYNSAEALARLYDFRKNEKLPISGK